MLPVQILHRFVFAGLLGVHQKRLKTIGDAVVAILKGGTVVPANVGRLMATETTPKHGIKRMDRLLGNRLLQGELTLFYREMAARVVDERPVILVDWTWLDGEKQAVLSAAVAHQGRALALYHEVHPGNSINNAKIESAFLNTLGAKVLPSGCRPIIVSDAGFKNPWFKKVLAHGWDFVGRLVSTVFVKPDGQQAWGPASAVVPDRVHQAKDYGEAEVSKSNPLHGRLVSVKHAPRGRKGKKGIDRKGVHAGCSAGKSYRSRAKKPALLFTSIRNLRAREVERIYASRMQIEETFRTLKSHRFGYSLEDTRSKYNERIGVLLLLATLATFVQVLLGAVIEHMGLHEQFQANTTRSRRVLSLFTLGGIALGRPKTLKEIGLAWIGFAVRQCRSLGSDPPLLRVACGRSL